MPSPSDPTPEINMPETDLPEIDLSECDREPIHQLGRIQFFGFLIAVSSGWTVVRVSDNTARYIGLTPDDLLGSNMNAVLTREAVHHIRTRMQMLQDPDTVERLFRVKILESLEQRFDVSIHIIDGLTILEFEPSEEAQQDYSAYVQPMINRVSKPSTVEQACEAAAKAVRALTGFNRVMVYRFDAHGDGEVIAEVREPGMEPFLGLRYPASDIPRQARALYLRNTLRIVSDVDGPTAAIVPETDKAGRPLDLSLSSLRSVSEIHLQYLRNMGVAASMSVSIVLHGRLWGLIACHHERPKVLSFQARSASQMFGQLFTLILEQKDNEARQAEQERARRFHDRMMARMADGRSIADQFDDIAEIIPSVIACDGIAAWTDGALLTAGAPVDTTALQSLLPFFDAVAVDQVYATHQLAADLPDGISPPDGVAGVLAIPVSRTPRDYIVLYRQEIAKEVRWAGAPDKPVQAPTGAGRLQPRASFAAWSQQVAGESAVWEDGEIRIAEALRATLTEVILKMSESALAERNAANERQETLIAELNHRVRNIFNVIRGIWTQSARNGTSVTDMTAIVGGRIQALARAYDQVTQVDWKPASLRQVLRTELAAYRSDLGTGLEIQGDDALLLPDAVSVLAMVVHELTTNSIKHGALSAAGGKITISIQTTEEHGLHLAWRERGGPPVTPPERVGFGTTIVQQSVPHELGGRTEMRFPPEGVEIDIAVPPRYVSATTAVPTASAPPQPAPQATPEPATGAALLLEDNFIIALATEEMLKNIGADRVWVCSSVRQALDVLVATEIDFGLLDVNLGIENSEDVAHRLIKGGIPFLFVSGYGDRMPNRAAFATVPVLQKPFTEERLAHALADMRLAHSQRAEDQPA